MDDQRKLLKTHKFAICIAYTVLVIVSLMLYSHPKWRFNSDNEEPKENYPTVTVNSDVHLLTIYDKPTTGWGLTEIASLKSPIRFDSLQSVIMETKSKSNYRTVFISFKHKNWFCFKDKYTENNVEGGYINKEYLEPVEINLFRYIRYLKEDRTANYPCYFHDN